MPVRAGPRVPGSARPSGRRAPAAPRSGRGRLPPSASPPLSARFPRAEAAEPPGTQRGRAGARDPAPPLPARPPGPAAPPAPRAASVRRPPPPDSEQVGVGKGAPVQDESAAGVLAVCLELLQAQLSGHVCLQPPLSETMHRTHLKAAPAFRGATCGKARPPPYSGLGVGAV
ncbi:actin nucleation-promoting factor WASL-like [Globicephala melas]|uniref:actin nucleation-promoting factor WASL-like n=1 Tax=Globicephala melas TaxID=9731 RepID=UPI00293D5B9A|nr:basic proline-rich protein-like [Globicephala melas]